MKQMAIIADDLTGASDSGVQFTQKGLETSVIFDIQHLHEDSQRVDVIVIDTDSRAITASDAYQRVKEASQKLKEIGFTRIYKKMDSTLRGNLGAEIDGVMDVFDFDFAVVAPAFPNIGRTTIGGFHYLHGIPIDQTEISRDPKCPVQQANLVSLLGDQSKRNVGLIHLQTIRSGRENVLNQITELLRTGVQLIVFDAEQNEDLESVTNYLSLSDYRILWVGSAGLTDLLPDRLHLSVSTKPSFSIVPSGKPVMLVAGSISNITRQQVSLIAKQPNVVPVELNPLMVIEEDQIQEEMDRCQAEIKMALEKGLDVAFYAGSSPDLVKITRELGGRRGMTLTEVSNRIADALGTVSSQVMQEIPLQGIILTGGDTAKAVCKHLGVTGMNLIKELEAGVPMSQLAGFRNLLAVTKAGAFGTEETLVRARCVLKGDSESCQDL